MPAFLMHPLAHIIAMVLGATLVLGGYAWWHNKVYSNGYKAAIAHVATQNKDALNAVRAAVKRVEDCSNVGEWDTARGMCVEQ